MENKRLHETNVKNCVRLYYITLNRTKSFWGSQLLLLASTGSQPSPLLPASVGFQSFPSLSAPSVFKLLTTALVEASGGDRLWTPPGCRPQEGCLCFLPLRSCPSLCWFMQKSPVPFCFVSCSPALLSSSKLAPVNSACLPACKPGLLLHYTLHAPWKSFLKWLISEWLWLTISIAVTQMAASCQPATPEPANPQMSPFLGTRLATMTASGSFCWSSIFLLRTLLTHKPQTVDQYSLLTFKITM